jgi:hypothetical protein
MTHKEAVVARNSLRGLEATPPPRPGAGSGVRWFYGFLLTLILIVAVIGVISTAQMGQTSIAIAIGIITAAFFSRIGA